MTLIFNAMFIAIHLTNFPQHRQDAGSLYAFLIFGINLPWTLSCVRGYLLVPTTKVCLVAADPQGCTMSMRACHPLPHTLCLRRFPSHKLRLM